MAPEEALGQLLQVLLVIYMDRTLINNCAVAVEQWY